MKSDKRNQLPRSLASGASRQKGLATPKTTALERPPKPKTIMTTDLLVNKNETQYYTFRLLVVQVAQIFFLAIFNQITQ